MNQDQEHNQEIDTYVRNLLDLNAHNWLAEGDPKIYSFVKNEVLAGRAKDDILKSCANTDGVDDDLLNSVGMTIDHLVRIKNQEIE